MKRIVILFTFFSFIFADTAIINVVNNLKGKEFSILSNGKQIMKVSDYKVLSRVVEVAQDSEISVYLDGYEVFRSVLKLGTDFINTLIIDKPFPGNNDNDISLTISPIKTSRNKDYPDEAIEIDSYNYPAPIGQKSYNINDEVEQNNNSSRNQLHVVYAGGMYFNPSGLNINVGDTVQFINEGGYHDVLVTVGPEILSLGACTGPCTIGELVFNTPGDYDYECSIGSHASQGMVGSISVAAMQDIAKVQIVHNSPYPTVDIYVDGSEALGDVPYRATTGLIELPTSTTVGIAPADGEIIANFPFTLEADEHYIVTASGIVGDNSHPFELVASTLETSAVDANHFALKVFHGVTDAPAVDIYANGSILIENLSFKEYTEYAQVPVGDYVIDVTANGSTTPVASFSAPLTGLGGGSGVVFASGFLSPASTDSSFALILTTPSGYSVQLPSTATALSTIDDYEISPLAFSLNQNYPNPFNPSTTISFDIYEASKVSLSIFDLNGRLVKNLMNGNLGAGTYNIDWNGKSTKGLSVAGGVYFYSITSGETSIIKKMSLIK